jgi:DHA1 family quinolone resistance protein-like MFS transporter
MDTVTPFMDKLDKHPFVFNKAIKLLVLFDSLLYLSSSFLSPIFAIFVERVGGGVVEAGWASAIFYFVSGLLIFAWGKLIDQTKEKELWLMFGYLIIASGYFMYLFVDSVWKLFLVEVVLAIGTSIQNPSFKTLFSIHLDKGREGQEWGLWESLTYFTMGIGAACGGMIVMAFGFHALLVIMGSITLANAVCIYFLPRRVL